MSLLVLFLSVYLKYILGKYQLFYIKPSLDGYFFKIWWTSIFLVFFLFSKKLYTKRLPLWDEAKEIVEAVIYTTLFSFTVIYLKRMWNFPRSILIFYTLFGCILIPFTRYYFKLFLNKIGIFSKDILILGAGNAGKIVANTILNDREMGFRLKGFLDDKKVGYNIDIGKQTYKVLGKINDFRSIVKKKNIDTVIIAMPSLGIDKLANITNYVQRYVKQLYIVPEMKGISTSNTELCHIFYEQIFLLQINNNLQLLRNRILKRLFDIFMAISLIPFIVPLVVVIGILIKLDSKGPVFFPHKRIGKDGKKIKIYKFRTMYIDATNRLNKILEKDENTKKEWETFFKLKNDPRITKIGKFLRKTSLDELPQFFNVLKGEMSFVGPRPVVKYEIKKYYKEYSKFYFMVKPGITGLWQVSGRNNISYEKRVKLDAWYVLNWSLWLDIVILFKTIRVVVKGEGAY